jgi:hypothetical protein
MAHGPCLIRIEIRGIHGIDVFTRHRGVSADERRSGRNLARIPQLANQCVAPASSDGGGDSQSVVDSPERCGVDAPKADAIPLAQVKQRMASTDIEVLGLAHALILERRFRIEPELSLGDSIPFFKHYYGRCFRESPDGEWSDSR